MTPEDLYDTLVRKPQEVYRTFDGRVEEFDISENMMVFRTSENEVYFSGLWKYFVPFKCQLPKNVRVQSVGASWDGFGVIDGRPWLLQSAAESSDTTPSLRDQRDTSTLT